MDQEEWVIWYQARFAEARERQGVTLIDVVICELATIRERMDEMQERITELERGDLGEEP